MFFLLVLSVLCMSQTIEQKCIEKPIYELSENAVADSSADKTLYGFFRADHRAKLMFAEERSCEVSARICEPCARKGEDYCKSAAVGEH